MSRFALLAALLFLAPALCDEEKEKENGNGEKPKKPPKTLFEWLPGDKPENGEEEGDEEDTIATDRPDFTEASSTVGLGRVQLEMGYTFIHDREDGTTTRGHSYPEALLRIGMFAEWFELRLGQNFSHIRQTGGADADITIATPGMAPVRASGNADGAEDLYLGVKLFLAEQKGILPETSLMIQTTVPTGARTLTADELLPGVNLLYGWDVIEDRLTLGGSTQANRSLDGVGHYYVEVAQSVTMGLRYTKKLASYTEYFGLYPSSAIDADTVAEHYVNGGFTYLVTNNFQLDIRAGLGLNRAADDFFAGAGFAIRY
jgi:hypothetical protein